MKVTDIMALFVVGLGLAGAQAVADPLTCIRVASVQGMDPCTRGIPGHAYATDERSPGSKICTRVYDDSNCKNSPQEFDHVRTPEGDLICTINYHQPPISASCATDPDRYIWVAHAWPEG